MSMPPRPFANRLADHRAVEIPAELKGDARVRFVAKVAAAAQRQAALANQCDAVLRVTGDILEQDGRILIPHEPAASADPAAVTSATERPELETLWWLSWAGTRALSATAAEGVPHGGIQIGSVFLDQTGRLKLGDFGLAPAFEAACGIDPRRHVLCETGGTREVAGRALSGTWHLGSEDEACEYGWIAPYFAHELLEGAVRLNLKSDQFSLGVLLFLWATGTHPYGATLSDPSLMCYFHLEPFALEDERPDWRECFERQRKDFTQDADRPVLAWSELVRKMLASDPGERFADPAKAVQLVQEFVPPAWARASTAISDALRLLDQGEVLACLESVTPWKDEPSLPETWRTQLAPWVAQIDAQKEAIVQQKHLEQRLAEGHAALDNLELEPARAAAREVMESADDDAALRRDAEELLRFCDEQEQFILSGADTLSQQYLESARAALGRNEFEEARQCLNAILQDPATPSARVARAHQLAAEVELAEQRVEQRRSQIAMATEDLREGRYAAAGQRLEAVLTDEQLPESLTAQAGHLLEDVKQAQARRAEYAAALNQARAAWERSDLGALEERLAAVPADFADPEIADVRRDLSDRCEPLRNALEHKGSAEKLFAAGDTRAARAKAELAIGVVDLPQRLADELNDLIARCNRVEEQARQAALEAARTALDQAQQAYEAADDAECRRLLEDRVLKTENLPDDQREQATGLLRACATLRAAKECLELAEWRLGEGDSEQALGVLDGLPQEPLPKRVTAEAAQLREQAEAARREFIRQQQDQLNKQFESAVAALDEGRLGHAEAALNKIADSRFVTDDLRARVTETRAAIAQQRPIVPALEAAKAALGADKPDLAKARAALKRLPPELPDWATKGVAALRQRVEEVQRQRREAALRRTQTALDAAQQALSAGDVSAARRQLEDVGEGIGLDPALAQRREQLSAQATKLEEQQRREAALRRTQAALDAAQRALDEGDTSAARRHLGNVGEGVGLEPALAQRHEQLSTLATEIEERQRRETALRNARAALDAAQQALDKGELASAGRHLDEAAEGIGFDATLAQRHEQLAALAVQLEQWLPKVDALAGAFEAGQTAPVYRDVSKLLKDSSIPALAAERLRGLKERAERRIAGRRAQISADLGKLTAELEQRGRRAKRFPERIGTITGDPLATSDHKNQAEQLLQRFEALPPPKRSRLPIVVAGSIGVIAMVWVVLTLIPGGQEPAQVPVDPTTQPLSVVETTDAERIEAALARLQEELQEARVSAVAAGRLTPDWRLSFDRSDGFPTTLVAKDEESGDTKRLADLASADELARLTLTTEVRETLFPPPPPPPGPSPEEIEAARQRLQEGVDAARAAAERPDKPAPRYVIRFDPADRVPTEVLARDESSNTEMRLATIGEDELADLSLRDEWREKLYPPPPPPPTAEEVAPEYLRALRAALPEGVAAEELKASGADQYLIELNWKGRNLRPFSPVSFDQADARYSPAVEQVVPHFRLQIDALQTLIEAEGLTIELAAAYNGAVRLSKEGADAELLEVDVPTGSVTLAVAARLAGDPRPQARFRFRGRLTDHTFEADDETRSTFARYLQEIQQHQLTPAVQHAAAELGVPKGATIRAPDDFAGGEQVTFALHIAGDRLLATLPLAWNAETLAYTLDRDRAVESIRTALQRLAGEDATRDRLAESWPSIRGLLAPAAGATGSEYFSRCQLLGLAPLKDESAETFAVAVEVTVGPRGAPAAEHLRIPAGLRLVEGVLGWDMSALTAERSEAKAAVSASLRALAEDKGLRQRRQTEALRALAEKLAVAAEAFRGQSGPQDLSAEVAVGGKTRRYRWEWDAAALKYGDPTETTPAAPATLEERLAALAASDQPDIGAFVGALGDVATNKIARFGAGSYQVAAEFLDAGTDPHARLVALSRGLQALIAPSRRVDPFPVVFVEHLMTPELVYGLGWQVATDADDVITAVTATKVWQVIPTADLMAYSRPAAFREIYSTDESLGERLLGQAFGGRLAASARPGKGSFGVVIAPDGPLWLTRWEQVRIRPRAVENLDARQAAPVDQVNWLRDILAAAEPDGPDSKWRRAGVWCVPTLPGRWQGGTGNIRLNLGVLVSGKKPYQAEFMKSASGELLFAAIEDPTLVGDFAWFDFVKRVRRGDIGYRFWDRGWARSWEQTPFTSFSLIQTEP